MFQSTSSASSSFTRPLRLLALVAGLTAASLAQAGPLSDAQSARVDKRQENQADRIEQGLASGELTRREAARLNHQQRQINRLESRTEADGKVTRREARHVEHAQNRASAHIARQKHDRQHRPRAD